MRYEAVQIKTEGSGAEAVLYTYFLDNTEEIDSRRERPVVLLCPGGGYAMTADREGEPVAMQFLAAGFHVAILRYSVAPARYPAALRQAAWSVAYLRENAEKFHIRKNYSDGIFGGRPSGGVLWSLLEKAFLLGAGAGSQQ